MVIISFTLKRPLWLVVNVWDVIDSSAVGVILSFSRTDFRAFTIHFRVTLFLGPENKNIVTIVLYT